MKNKIILLGLITLAFVSQIHARDLIPPDNSKGPVNEYKQEVVDQYFFNRLPIAQSCSEDLDVKRSERSAQIEEAEARLASLINFSETREYRQIPGSKYPLYHSAFLLKLILLRVESRELVEQKAVEYNQLMSLSDARLKEIGVSRLPRQYKQIIDNEISLLDSSADQDKMKMESENLALQNFLSTHKNLSTTLIGLDQNEKRYFNTMKSNFEASRCQLIKKDKRIQSLKNLTI